MMHTLLRVPRALAAVVALVLSLTKCGWCVVISEQVDAEIAKLHASAEEHWDRISNLTAELRAFGAIAGGTLGGLPNSGLAGTGPALGPKLSPQGQPMAPGAGLGHQGTEGLGGSQSSSNAHSGASVSKVPPEMLSHLQKLQSEYSTVQQLAFRIGHESNDNAELQRHPEINNYIQSLREFNPRLKAAASDLQREYTRITGKQLEKPKKKAKKEIRGLSEEEIRAQARKAIMKDDRPYRSKAMDLISEFRERQLQMQDKQRDLQVSMDGPDWPKEDWPLTSADAKHVGEAENMISGSLQELNKRLEPLGGLGRVHESNDQVALEQLKALGDMMAGYCELIDRHVSTVKRTYRSKRRPRKGKPPPGGSGAATSPGGPPLGGPPPAASLRDRLLNFGNTAGSQQPFAWLRNDGSAAAGAATGHAGLGVPNGGAAGGVGGTYGSFSGMATPGSSQSPPGLGISGLANAGWSGSRSSSMADGNGASRQFPSAHAGTGLGGPSSSAGTSNGLSASGAVAGFPAQAPPMGLGAGMAPAGGVPSAFGGAGAFGSQHLPPQSRAWSTGLSGIHSGLGEL